MALQISFEQPAALWLLFSVPLLVFTHLYFLHHAKRKAIAFGNFATIQRVTGKKLLTTNSVLLIVRSFVIVLLVLAAAGTTLWRNTDKNVNDVVIVIDASASMAATDMDGPRIDAAKEAAKQFVQQLDQTANIGVVQFSGLAEVVTPPTADRQAVLAAIDRVQIHTIGGTDLTGAIVAGTNLLTTSRYGRAMLLMTDGVSSVSLYDSNPVERAIAYSQQHHIVIHTIGVGTQSNAGFLPGLDAQVATFDEQNLEAIAKATGGEYTWARSPGQLQEAYQNIIAEGSTAFVPVNLSIACVFLALLSLFLEWGLINTRYRILP